MHKSLTASVGLAGSLMLWNVAAAQADSKQRTVLVVVAHPDDELFIGPAIAAEARTGSQVHILYATSGDVGPGVSGMDPGEELASMRRQEASCAAQALGAAPIFVNLGDGTLAHHPQGSESPAALLRERLHREIVDRRPDVVMTWGPDGGYGHADHRMVSAVSSEAIQSLDTYARPRLLYSAIVEGRMPDNTPFGRWAGTDPTLITVTYRYSEADLAAANTAAQCHETQFDAAARLQLMPFLAGMVWQGEVGFREAF